MAKKLSGKLDVVFLSRISPTKNLHFALAQLKGLHGEIAFDLYGPLEDKAYWSQCRTAISQMPDNIKVTYCGEVQPDM